MLRRFVGSEDWIRDKEIRYILEKLPPIVQRLRDMSPIYNVKV